MIGLTGSVIVLFSALCFAAAVLRQLGPGPPPPAPDTRLLPRWLLLLVNGFLVLVALVVFVALGVLALRRFDPSRPALAL